MPSQFRPGPSKLTFECGYANTAYGAIDKAAIEFKANAPREEVEAIAFRLINIFYPPGPEGPVSGRVKDNEEM